MLLLLLLLLLCGCRPAVVSDASAEKFKNGVVRGHTVMRVIRIVGFVLGPLVFVIGVVHAVIGGRMLFRSHHPKQFAVNSFAS